MRRIHKLLAVVLIVCLCFSIVPGTVTAGENIGLGQDGQEDEKLTDDGLPEENQEDEMEPGEDETEPVSDGEDETDQITDGTKEPEVPAEPEEPQTEGEEEKDKEEDGKKDEKDETDRKLESNDPGYGRYMGYASGDFYGPSSRAGGVSISHDSRFGEFYIKQNGIDVSQWNGNINWTKVKNAGYKFAIIRVAGCYATSDKKGNAQLFMDDNAIQNIKGASAAGLSVGVYFFSQAISEKEARAEARYILKAIEPYRNKIKLPVVFDFEFFSDSNGEGGRLYNAHLTKTKATNVCNAFCDTVSQEGYTPMLYSNLSMLSRHLKPEELNCKLWLAQWAFTPTYAGAYEYWQYTSSGKVPGMTGNVDLNIRYVKTSLIISSKSENSIKLKWRPVNGASGYEVYRKDSGGSYKRIASVEGLTYTNKNLKRGTAYTYKVRSYTDTEGGREYGSYKNSVTGATRIAGTSISGKGTAYDSVRLSWKKASQADGYHIQRYNSSERAYKTIKTIKDGSTTYTNSCLNSNTTYKYRIRAYKDINGTRSYSTWSDAVSIKTKGPVAGTVTGDYVNVRSGPGTSYKSLAVLRKNARLTITGSREKWYRVSVSVKGRNKVGYITKEFSRLGASASGNKLVLKAYASAFDRIKLSWNRISGAAGYQIQRYNSSKQKYVTLKTITKGTTISYTDGSLNAGTSYQYRVRAYRIVNKSRVYGSYSSAVSAATQKARTGRVTGSGVNIRKGPGTSYKRVGTVGKNEKLTITGSRGEWYRISIMINNKKTTAYITKEYVKLI